MYTAWNRVSGDVDSWSSRLNFVLVLQSGEVEVGEREDVDVDEDDEDSERELKEEQEDVHEEDLEEHELALLLGAYTGRT
jgi:hypothetical protein